MKHILNQYFDKIYCVTVANFYDRHELVKEQLRGIEFEWVYSPTDVSPQKKLSASEVSLIHGDVKCLDDAMSKGYKRIAIWEDDGVLTSTEENMKKFFEEVPERWDCLYMGHASWSNPNWLVTFPVSGHVRKIRWGTGSSFNAVQSHVFELVKKTILKYQCPLDFGYYEVFKLGNSYAPAEEFFSDPISSIDDKPWNPKPPEGKVFLPSRIVRN